MSIEKLYTVKEVAESWGYCEKVVRGLIQRGELKAVKFGKEYRIRSEDMKECLDKAVVDGVHDEEV